MFSRSLISILEPAQEALRNCQLFPIIMSMLERSCFDLRLLTQVCRLLDFAAEDCESVKIPVRNQEFTVITVDPKLCPETSVAGICDTILSHNLEVEDQVSLGNAIVAILKHEHFQQLSIMHDHIMAILDLYVFTYTQDPKAVESSGLLAPNLVHRPTLDAEDETQLSALRSALAAALWDISSLTEFSERYPPTSSLVETIVSWISIPEPQMQLCACSILRNISCSDRTSIQMVHDLHVQKPVSYILKDATNLQILEEALRLLKNLALPAQNKPAISSTLSLDIITSLWSKFKSPTIQYAAISLTRHLLRGCCSNVRQFLTSETNARERLNNTSVSRLVALYESVDDPAIRTEVVRTVVEVFRTLRAETSAPKTSLLETGAYLTALWRANIAKPVVAMILESKNASLMTEGWFGLSLMASSKEGSDAVYEALCGQNSLAVFRATLSSQESQSRDRDNARILADKLVKYSVNCKLKGWKESVLTMFSQADNPARLAILKPMLSMYESSLESKETATNTADLEEL